MRSRCTVLGMTTISCCNSERRMTCTGVLSYLAAMRVSTSFEKMSLFRVLLSVTGPFCGAMGV